MKALHKGHVRICTPEGVDFHLRLASPVSRMYAWFIDLMIILVIHSILSSILILFSIIDPQLTIAFMTILAFIINFGYGILTEILMNGQSPGKRSLKLRVVDEHGLRLTSKQIIIRNLLRLVDSLPLAYLMGGASCFFSKKCQRLGDIAARTIVIQQEEKKIPDAEKIMSGKYNSFRRFPHLVARLRKNITPEESQLALKALMRKDSLNDEKSLSLYHELAEHFKTLVQFPEDEVKDISDEQYLKNVVDCLFNDNKKKRAKS